MVLTMCSRTEMVIITYNFDRKKQLECDSGKKAEPLHVSIVRKPGVPQSDDIVVDRRRRGGRYQNRCNQHGAPE